MPDSWRLGRVSPRTLTTLTLTTLGQVVLGPMAKLGAYVSGGHQLAIDYELPQIIDLI